MVIIKNDLYFDSNISVLGRNTQGVRIINLDEKQEFVTGLAVVDDEDKAGEEIH